MANTYHKLYIQTVFPVKYRKALIHSDWKSELQAVIGNLINETGCKTIIVNGMEDHMHCFFGLKPSISVSEVMKSAKAKSSKWINEHGYLTNRFEWQKGFGGFSYSHSHVDAVYHYIKNQEKHHKRMSFWEEYTDILDKYGIDYDERYLFEGLK
jgi:REP element-mobilizing transposase RayT